MYSTPCTSNRWAGIGVAECLREVGAHADCQHSVSYIEWQALEHRPPPLLGYLPSIGGSYGCSQPMDHNLRHRVDCSMLLLGQSSQTSARSSALALAIRPRTRKSSHPIARASSRAIESLQPSFRQQVFSMFHRRVESEVAQRALLRDGR